MLVLNKEINIKWIVIGGAVIIGLVIFIIMSIPKSKPLNPIPTISEAQIALQKQYESQLKDKDATINDYKSRLTVSYEKYTSITNKYLALQKEKENVKVPVTNTEIRNRFIAFGYTPLPVK